MSETEESEIKFIGRIYKITSPNTEKSICWINNLCVKKTITRSQIRI